MGHWLNERYCFLCILLGFGWACSRPSSAFLVPPGQVQVLDTCKLLNQSTKADTYLWDFGDGIQSADPHPQHIYRRSGRYTIQLTASKGNKSKISSKNIMVMPPNQCMVLIETPFGQMTAVLFDDTPLHQDNFTSLVDSGFFDELIFHRVIDGFMIQGGDPGSRNAPAGIPLGAGGPGYQVDAEFSAAHVHVKGAIAAARTGDNVNPQKKSSGSQFYIVQGRIQTENELSAMQARKNILYTPEQKTAYLQQGGTPALDMEYTVFGQVISGLEVIDKIAQVHTDGRNRPIENVTMKITLIK